MIANWRRGPTRIYATAILACVANCDGGESKNGAMDGLAGPRHGWPGSSGGSTVARGTKYGAIDGPAIDNRHLLHGPAGPKREKTII